MFFIISGLLLRERLAVSEITEVIKEAVCVGGGSLLKQQLPCRGNITAVVFPKRLKLSVISRAHSALTSFGIGLAYASF